MNTGRSQHAFLFVALWLALALTVGSCGRPAAGVSPTPVAVGSVGVAQTEPPPTQTTLPAEEEAALSPPSAATIAPAPTPVPTYTPTPLPLLGDACGLMLPLLPAPGPTPQTGLDAGQDLAAVPAEAREAVRYLLEHAESVALVAYRLNAEGQGIYLNADAQVPLASTAKLVQLVAYANAVEAGTLDPAEWVDLTELERFYLPNSDLRSHQTAVADAVERGLVVNNKTPLEEIVWMMVRHSSNTATDYLHERLGQATIEATALALGLTQATAPCPWLGMFLSMSNHTRAVSDQEALAAYLAAPAAYGADVVRLTEAYAGDESFRDAESAWRPANRRPNMVTQRAFSAALGPMGTAREMADAMARIAANELGSDFVNILVRRALEWPMIFPVNEERFWTMGYKGGSLPGILTGVYYGEPLVDRTPVIVAIFYRDLPNSTYRSWRRDWPHDELALWLMYDSEAIPTLRQLLRPPS